MKCLFIGIVFFACNYVIWGQDLVFPDDEETSHVSGGNRTVIKYIKYKIEKNVKVVRARVIIHVVIHSLVEVILIILIQCEIVILNVTNCFIFMNN